MSGQGCREGPGNSLPAVMLYLVLSSGGTFVVGDSGIRDRPNGVKLAVFAQELRHADPEERCGRTYDRSVKAFVRCYQNR